MSQSLYVRFSREARVDKKHLHATGETRWVDVEYVEIHVPGDKTNVPHRPVTDEDRTRFAKQYEAWLRGQGDIHDGQPLKTWAAISPAECNMLAQANVHTVEQLAGVSDENVSRIGPVLALRDKARKHLEQSRASAPLERLTRELEDAKAREAELLERFSRMEAMLEQQTAPESEPKRRGRPPKDRSESPAEPVSTEA